MPVRTIPPPKNASPRHSFSWKIAGLIALPLVLLAAVIVTFLATNGVGLQAQSDAPDESVTFEQTILRPGVIEFTLRNTSSQPITISAININDAIWPFAANPSATIPRLGKATFLLDYHWVEGENYDVDFFTADSARLSTNIAAATSTVTPNGITFLSYLLIGLYVGVIPVLLGMAWFPVLRRLGQRWMVFMWAISVGLLIFLGINATNEALSLAQQVGGPFQGVGLVGVGIVATFMLLAAISRRQSLIQRSEVDQRLALAFMIALGIGLHNLGEGLAIGASFSQGAFELGTALVIGFIIQNITEGLGIIIPVLKDNPSVGSLVLLGLLGGGPAILGSLAGGFFYSKVLAVLFLAIGAGAIFEVVYEVANLIQRISVKRPMPIIVFSGVTTGLLALYIMGLFFK